MLQKFHLLHVQRDSRRLSCRLLSSTQYDTTWYSFRVRVEKTDRFRSRQTMSSTVTCSYSLVTQNQRLHSKTALLEKPSLASFHRWPQSNSVYDVISCSRCVLCRVVLAVSIHLTLLKMFDSVCHDQSVTSLNTNRISLRVHTSFDSEMSLYIPDILVQTHSKIMTFPFHHLFSEVMHSRWSGPPRFRSHGTCRIDWKNSTFVLKYVLLVVVVWYQYAIFDVRQTWICNIFWLCELLSRVKFVACVLWNLKCAYV